MFITRHIRIILLFSALAFVAGGARADAYDDMIRAIGLDDTRTAASLLNRGFEVNSVTREGESLLMLAVKEGKPNIVRTLLAAKPRVDARNAYGETALMLAALRGHADIVEMLLAHGAEVNQSGWTPLMYAAANSHQDIARKLISRGAKVDSAAENGTTALMMARRGGHLPIGLRL